MMVGVGGKMTDLMKAKIVEAIRNDPKVGRGSCSTWDECYSDSELIEALKDCKTVRAAVAFARRIEKIREERERDAEGW